MLGVCALAYFALRGKLWARIVLLILVYGTAIASIVILIAFPQTDRTGKTAVWTIFAVELVVGALMSIPSRKLKLPEMSSN